MTQEESNRQYEVIDMLLTGHSWLRDRYARWALILNLCLLGSVVLLNACVFIGDDTLRILVQSPEAAKFVIGVFSIIVFFVSLVEYRLDWKGKSVLHEDAAKKLTSLKLEYRNAYDEFHGTDEETNLQLTKKYERVQEDMVKIPDSLFNAAKSRHLLKKELSKQLNKHPFAPLWSLRLRLRWKGLTGLTGEENCK